MLWGCLNYLGAGTLYIIKDIINRYLSTRILKISLKSIAALNLKNYTFRKDYDPKRTGKYVKEISLKKNISVIEFFYPT